MRIHWEGCSVFFLLLFKHSDLDRITCLDNNGDGDDVDNDDGNDDGDNSDCDGDDDDSGDGNVSGKHLGFYDVLPA